MLENRKLETKIHDMIEITGDVNEIVDKSGVKSGICIIFVPHTTAGLLITSFWDPRGHEDIQDDLSRIIPTRVNYKHQDSPTDASGHVKSALVGPTLSLIVEGGKLQLGSSQGIIFAEFDGPRPREYYVKVYAEK